MSDYRSAYERYYKNINNAARGKKDNNKYLPLSDSFIGPKSMRGAGSNDGQGNYLIKRIIRELIGATLLLVIFFGLKFIPLEQVRNIHSISKQAVSQNFDYDKSIETFSYINIGNFKLDDLRTENLKVKASEFINYLKNISNTQFKNGN